MEVFGAVLGWVEVFGAVLGWVEVFGAVLGWVDVFRAGWNCFGLVPIGDISRMRRGEKCQEMSKCRKMLSS